jgi:glycerol-3-phosphate dehydrogenase
MASASETDVRKLIAYRHTGQDVVAKVRQALGRRKPIADTATLHLPD